MANGEFGERERRERRIGRGQVEQPLKEDRGSRRGQTDDGVGHPRPVCGLTRTFVASGRLVALVVRGGLKALVAHRYFPLPRRLRGGSCGAARGQLTAATTPVRRAGGEQPAVHANPPV